MLYDAIYDSISIYVPLCKRSNLGKDMDSIDNGKIVRDVVKEIQFRDPTKSP